MTFAKRTSAPNKLASVRPVAPATSQQEIEREVMIEFRRARRQRFATQLEFAFYMQVAPSTVARWESGESTIPAWAFRRMEQAPVIRKVAA